MTVDYRDYDLVMVQWIDSKKDMDWVSLDELLDDVKLSVLCSVGWLVKRTEAYVQLVGTMDADGLVAEAHSIPCVAIDNLRVLRKAREKK